MTLPEMPQAWNDLIEAIILLSSRQNNDISPFYCEHDQLTVCATPSEFTNEELERLDELGFHPENDDSSFYSFRFGSA